MSKLGSEKKCTYLHRLAHSEYRKYETNVFISQYLIVDCIGLKRQKADSVRSQLSCLRSTSQV